MTTKETQSVNPHSFSDRLELERTGVAIIGERNDVNVWIRFQRCQQLRPRSAIAFFRQHIANFQQDGAGGDHARLFGVQLISQLDRPLVQQILRIGQCQGKGGIQERLMRQHRRVHHINKRRRSWQNRRVRRAAAIGQCTERTFRV